MDIFRTGIMSLTWSPSQLQTDNHSGPHAHKSAMAKPARMPPKPTVEKSIVCGGDSRLTFCVVSMQGWRMSQEDAHFAHLTLPLPPPLEGRGVSMFGVFDGHGGSAVSKYVAENLWINIASQPTFQKGDYLNAIKQGFYQTDNAANASPLVDCEQTGCTAIVAMVTQSNALFVGNAGDCRAVLSCGGTALALSLDHKADAEMEQNRITAAGGLVQDGRVMGDLAVSRSLGDFRFKRIPTLPLNQQVRVCNCTFSNLFLDGFS
jgi:protein phosphatase 2C family protein 2/3